MIDSCGKLSPYPLLPWKRLRTFELRKVPRAHWATDSPARTEAISGLNRNDQRIARKSRSIDSLSLPPLWGREIPASFRGPAGSLDTRRNKMFCRDRHKASGETKGPPLVAPNSLRTNGGIRPGSTAVRMIEKISRASNAALRTNSKNAAVDVVGAGLRDDVVEASLAPWPISAGITPELDCTS